MEWKIILTWPKHGAPRQQHHRRRQRSEAAELLQFGLEQARAQARHCHHDQL